MKTLYGMPIEKFFPDEVTVRKQIQEEMPVKTSVFNPAAAQQMVQQANDMKARSDAHRREVEQRVKGTKVSGRYRNEEDRHRRRLDQRVAIRPLDFLQLRPAGEKEANHEIGRAHV